jgi:hypothetical protein
MGWCCFGEGEFSYLNQVAGAVDDEGDLRIDIGCPLVKIRFFLPN